METYNANPVTLDVCTGIKDEYRITLDDKNAQSNSAATPKTFLSLITTVTFGLVIIFFLL